MFFPSNHNLNGSRDDLKIQNFITGITQIYQEQLEIQNYISSETCSLMSDRQL